MPDDEGGNVELPFSVIFTVITSPDVDGANMWGHMRGVVDAGNLYKRPLLAVEASHKDGQFSENNEEWATFNSVASATAQCGVGQCRISHRWRIYTASTPAARWKSNTAGRPKTTSSPRIATPRERYTSTGKRRQQQIYQSAELPDLLGQ